jgi:hypothetical protein
VQTLTKHKRYSFNRPGAIKLILGDFFMYKKIAKVSISKVLKGAAIDMSDGVS